LAAFLQIKEYDPNRFVWLIETMRENAFLSITVFRQICESTLEIFADGKTNESALSRLRSIIILSTSPTFQQIPTLKLVVDITFTKIVETQRDFANRYLFGGFIACGWTAEYADGEPSDQISVQLRLWRLYLVNLIARIEQIPEIPKFLITAFMDDSLIFFNGYYGEVQASKTYSVRLRMDILELVHLFEIYYPMKIPIEIKQKLWYLLLLVAISGCSETDLEHVIKQDCKESDELFLGVGHTDREFNDYLLALCRLTQKFETEFEHFPSMTQFVRAKYGGR
jgi:hypothetical protein